jgi:hypothetical protein
VACEECRSLASHVFRTPDDLIHALRLAAEEANRGVLAAVEEREAPRVAEQEAIYSALDAGAMPGSIRYRFRCTTCSERFTLEADMDAGTGRWTREAGEDRGG